MPILALFVFALIPTAITFWLPRRWLLLWLPLFWGAVILLWNGINFSDDPAFLSASVVFLPLCLVNGIATIARVSVVVSDLNRELGRGYGHTE